MSTPFGPYRLVRRIASGGMGEVYLAVLERPGGFAKTVALKLILPAGSPERFQALFESEAAVAAALNHANIVQVFDHGVIEGKSFLTMELVEGPDLATLLAAAGPVFPPGVAVEIGVQACRGLDHAHRRRDLRGRPMGIVHRDVSPPNILVSADGQVKLADFGLAAVRRAAGTENLLAGKLCYMSPEQAKGEELGPRSDLYALGLVLFELLAGQRAFEPLETSRATLEAVRAGRHALSAGGGRDLAPAMRAVLERVLAPAPADRHETASDLAVDLAAACPPCGPEKLAAFVKPHAPAGGAGEGLAPEPTEVARSPVAARETLQPSRRRWKLPLAIVAAACWGAGFAWWAFSPAPPPRPAPPPSTLPRAPGGLEVDARPAGPAASPGEAPEDASGPPPDTTRGTNPPPGQLDEQEHAATNPSGERQSAAARATPGTFDPDERRPEGSRAKPGDVHAAERQTEDSRVKPGDVHADECQPEDSRAKPGDVRVALDPAARCEIDHRIATGESATLADPGPHLIRLRPAGAAAPEALLRLAPDKAGGLLLAVNARPWMRIHIDGRTAGQTPRSKLRLAPGTRRIELERGGHVFRLTIQIPGAAP